MIIPSHLCQLQPSLFWNIKILIIFEPITRIHPNGASIKFSDPPIIISSYGTPLTSPTVAPSTATLMDTAASSYSDTARGCRLDTYIILFHSILIREYLINFNPVTCDCTVIGYGNGNNTHMHLYGRLHGSEKFGRDLFIEKMQL